MTPQVSEFILGSLEDTDKYIQVADGQPIFTFPYLALYVSTSVFEI